MCTDKWLSKFQRKVVSQLKIMLMPYDIDFSYSKSSKNHLKVVVEGVEKPLYTSSTPSDYRALEQFKAEVRKRIKKLTAPKREELKRQSQAIKDEKLQQSHLVKLIETHIKKCSELLVQSEKNKLISRGLSAFDAIRTELALDQIDKVLYDLDIQLDAKALNLMVKKVMKILNKELPTKLHYTDSLIQDIDDPNLETSDFEPDEIAIVDEVFSPEELNMTTADLPAFKSELSVTGVKLWLVSAELNRTNELRTLNKHEALKLIQEIQDAQELNHDAALNLILEDVMEKDVDVLSLIERLKTLIE
ncbi:hypothetical protein [Colwellia piezophila]|uniref:hypothetical protein n=1 Tax=Colwellia piezophila TaxID=211668 RepID=UPI00036F8F96|nr:hypothetical protein [Colwellia piezophila]